MGRTLIILLIGFSTAFTILSGSRNKRIVDASETLSDQFSRYSATNAAASGVYMALNRLYLDNSWRTGYSNLVLNGDTVSVALEDNATNPSIPPNQIHLQSTSHHLPASRTLDVMVFDGKFDGFAVWAKDSVQYVTTLDSLGNIAPPLLMDFAPYMPDIQKSQLVTEATNQNHVPPPDAEGKFVPPDGYPNGSFYYIPGTQTPNVIVVQGNLQVKKGRTIYGIYLVEGNVQLDQNAKIQGILYLPNSQSILYNANSDNTYVYGGVLTWGKISGSFGQIHVQLLPAYMSRFVGNFVPVNPPLKVLSWK